MHTLIFVWGGGFMKHGKKLKLWMKKLIKVEGLSPDNWLYVKNLPDVLVIVHRESSEVMRIELKGGEQDGLLNSYGQAI